MCWAWRREREDSPRHLSGVERLGPDGLRWARERALPVVGSQ